MWQSAEERGHRGAVATDPGPQPSTRLEWVSARGCGSASWTAPGLTSLHYGTSQLVYPLVFFIVYYYIFYRFITLQCLWFFFYSHTHIVKRPPPSTICRRRYTNSCWLIDWLIIIAFFIVLCYVVNSVIWIPDILRKCNVLTGILTHVSIS